MFMTENGADGHKGSKVGATITEVWREDNKVLGRGRFSTDEDGQELKRLISEEILTGVSSDVGGAILEQELAEDGTTQNRIVQGRIMGATVLPFPAFDETRIAVTAAAVPAAAPTAWFADPNLKEKTPLTITKEGQIFGHAATWDTCHIGRPDQCLTPPHSSSDYAYFRTGVVHTAEGTKVHTGPITLGTGHASLTLTGTHAAEHYDNTGTAIADVVTGEDPIGIWMAGSVRPGVSDERLAELRAAAISGDWRGINGRHELVALLAVNTPGFPVPRTRATFSANDDQLALVAAGVVTDEPVPVAITDNSIELSPDEEKELTLRVEALEKAIIAFGHRQAVTLSQEGHPFYGNQWTSGAGGGGEGKGVGTKRELTDEEKGRVEQARQAEKERIAAIPSWADRKKRWDEKAAASHVKGSPFPKGYLP
jgi:hypothetical protein